MKLDELRNGFIIMVVKFFIKNDKTSNIIDGHKCNITWYILYTNNLF